MWNESTKSLLISRLEKHNLFRFISLLAVIDLKMDGPFLEQKSSFKILRLSFSSKLDWISNTVSMAKIVTNKIIDSFYEVFFP